MLKILECIFEAEMHQLVKHTLSVDNCHALITCESTRFGKLSMISQQDRILFCSFDPPDVLTKTVHHKYPFLQIKSGLCAEMEKAFSFVNGKNNESLILGSQGTDFQIAVWNKILQIPSGKTTSYQKIAISLKNEKAIRAVGAAVGANEHAFLIPCHRVLYSNGHSGNFRWGTDLKIQLLCAEKNIPFVTTELF